MHLKVPSVRIVAPLPGKNAVGIEIPNEYRADVRLKEVIHSSAPRIAKSHIPLFLGKDAEGRPLVCDLADMPHLLIAGTTGTGKSVCLNAIILSLLMTRRPDETRLILMDPKRGVEMECFSRVPHLMCPIIDDMKKAEAVLAWAVDKMEERYDLLRRARVRNIAGYNELSAEEILRRVQPIDDDERRRIPERLSYIVMVIDEMSDLMMQFKKRSATSPSAWPRSRAPPASTWYWPREADRGRDHGAEDQVEPAVADLLQGSGEVEQQVVLDQMGADKLLGKGDTCCSCHRAPVTWSGRGALPPVTPRSPRSPSTSSPTRAARRAVAARRRRRRGRGGRRLPRGRVTRQAVRAGGGRRHPRGR
ncbi:MAG: DNA translocase FtsK [Gemmataceae bacterium]